MERGRRARQQWAELVSRLLLEAWRHLGLGSARDSGRLLSCLLSGPTHRARELGYLSITRFQSRAAVATLTHSLACPGCGLIMLLAKEHTQAESQAAVRECWGIGTCSLVPRPLPRRSDGLLLLLLA